jgi:hypothetical protein
MCHVTQRPYKNICSICEELLEAQLIVFLNLELVPLYCGTASVV